MRLKLVRDETHLDFLGLRKIAGGFSIIAMIASVVVFLMMGLNFGISRAVWPMMSATIRIDGSGG